MIRIDMPMPSSCRECPFHERDRDCCILFSYGVPDRYQIEKFMGRPYWCELEDDEIIEQFSTNNIRLRNGLLE